MNEYITNIDLATYNNSYSSFNDVYSLSSDEDIATFIDTFEESGLKGYLIVKVLEYDGKYIFVYANEDTGFDFFEELNKLCTLDVKLTSQNVKLLYDKSKSRGYYSHAEKPKDDDVSTGEIGYYDDDEATGFIDDSDLPEQLKVTRVLYHKKTGTKIPINDSHGVTIGRNSTKSEYVVSNSKMSRQHARVYKDGNKYMVHDFDSVNGTFVDGLRVKSDLDREIMVGSTLFLANEEFILE